MSPSRPAVVDGPPRPARTEYRAAQMRVVSAALGLFAERGVSGTSLQMIANAMGVTKAAVYFQFKTKVAHPRTAELDDETLRSHLLPIARRLFDLPDPRQRP